MEINVAQIRRNPGEHYTFHLVEEMAPLELADFTYHFIGPVNFDLTVTNTGELLLVSGTLKTTLRMQCVRCLEFFDLDIEAPFDEKYCHQNESADYIDAAEKETDCHLYQGDKINLDEQVRESLVLSLPMKPLCQEGCLGICHTCGQNLNIKKCQCKKENIDPRLDVLRKLLDN